MNQDAIRTLSSKHTTRETTRQTGVRRKTESDSEERWSSTIQICLHEAFMLDPRQIGSCWNSETFGPENEWALWIRLCPVETCSAISGGIAQSSAEISKHVDKITVFVDSDFADDPVSRKSTTGLVAQIGNHTVKSGSTLQSLTALSVGETEFYAVVKGGQVGLSFEIYVPKMWEFQWRLKYKVTVWRRILWRIAWEQDSERNTLTRGASGYQNESKTETSVSIRCLQRRTVQMLERSQSYFNNIASLQDWSPTDHGSHTPLQDEGDEPLMDLVKGCSPDIDTETRRDHGNTSTETASCQRWSWTSRRMCKLSETSERWTSLSTSHDDGSWQHLQEAKHGQARCTKRLWTDWRQVWIWRILQSPWTRDDGESRYLWYQDQAVIVHEPSVIASTLWIGRDAVDQAWTVWIV